MKDKEFHPAPEWLTEEYLEKVLRKYKNDSKVSIIQLTLQPATAKGENYASIMTRIKVKYTATTSAAVQEGSFIAKTSYENDPYVASIFKPYQTFPTEMLMYEKIVPALTSLLEEIHDEDKLFADTIHVDYEHTAIIFEDLGVTNYAIGDRLEGYDLLHSKMALRKLAKMHAAAAVYNERVPDVLTKLDRGIFNRHTKGFAGFFEGMLEVCADYAGENIELGDYYKQKLKKLKSHVMEYSVRVYDPQPNHFLTLVHGDYWVNNIMLQYCNGASNGNGGKTLKDLLLIDLQFCCWASPAVDLHYFFNTSLTEELLFDQQDELIQYYHQILVETLKKFNFRGHIPALHEFCLQIEAGRFYAVISALVERPMMTNDQTEDADVLALISNDERGRRFRKILYDNKRIQKYINKILPIFDRRGLLDVYD